MILSPPPTKNGTPAPKTCSDSPGAFIFHLPNGFRHSGSGLQSLHPVFGEPVYRVW